MFDAAVAALDAVGARGGFLTSTSDLARRVESASGDRHLVRPFAPLAPLLQRSRAIVHSGANGTHGLALLAGVPSVVAPCLFDQVVHARRQQDLGTLCWARRPRHLHSAIGRLLGSDAARYTARAQSFAAETAANDGTAAMVAEAESLVRD